MAILNIQINSENLVPENGTYQFSIAFLNTTTDELLMDAKYPQGQTFSSATVPTSIPVTIGNGVYTINNVKLKLTHNDITEYFIINGESVNCNVSCSSFPIVSIIKTTGTTYTVTMSSAVNASYAWKLYNTASTIVSNGTVNVTGNTFTITTPTLSSGKYLFEITGTTCNGKESIPLVITNTLPDCPSGPTITYIADLTATSLRFGFSGQGIFGINWRIKQGGNIIRSGELVNIDIAIPGDVTFNSDNPTITFATIDDGTYTLEIEGSKCKSASVSTQSFTLTSTAPLQFISGSPSVSGTGPYTISLNINKSGSYKTIILNTTNGVYYRNGNLSYIANTPIVTSSLPVGSYYIEVGSLNVGVVIQAPSGNCTDGDGRNPTITGINYANSTGLSFGFDANNVFSLKWRIKQAGNVIRNDVVTPPSNQPFITYNEIPVGTYQLEIEGNSCTSPVSTATFTISAAPISNNAGVIVKNANGKTIETINAEFLQVVGTDAGGIKVNYDLTMPSDNNSKTVVPLLMNQYMVPYEQDVIDAFRSANGCTDCVDGNYHIYDYYYNPEISNGTYEQIRANRNVIWGKNARNTNSRQLQYAIVSKQNNATI